METKVNYILTGLFVLFLTAATIGFGLWLASDIRITSYHPYISYFNESVAGLNLNGPVKYRGVTVGRVRDLQLDPENPTRVRVLMDIAKGTPIRTDTYAILNVQGLTGIAFVELEGGENGEPLPSPLPDGGIPEIPSKLSLYNRLDQALSNAAVTIDELGKRLVEILNQENIESFHHALHNLEVFTAVLNHDKERLDKILANAEGLSSDLAEAGHSLPVLAAKADRLMTDYDQLSKELSAAAATVTRLGTSLEKMTGGTGQDVRGTVHRLEAEIRRLSREVADAARGISTLTRKLNDHPNALIYGNPQPPPGPGE